MISCKAVLRRASSWAWIDSLRLRIASPSCTLSRMKPPSVVYGLPVFGPLYHPDARAGAAGTAVRIPAIDEIDLAAAQVAGEPVSYTHLRAHETRHDLVC